MIGGSIAGVVAAVVTPLRAGGRPDEERFLRHARWLLSHGCDGLNVLGTTGEATSFSAPDRKALMTAAASGIDPASMMVGTGCPDLPTTVELTSHAHDQGYCAALVLPPFYYKSVTEEGIFSYFADLVCSTNGSPIPIYLYNFPQMTQLQFSRGLVRRLVASFPGRIRGVKDSSGDLDYAASLAELNGFAVFPSDEAALAEAARHRFAGCISATVNLSAPLAQRLWQSPDDADLLVRVRDMRRSIAAQPLIPAVKLLVARLHDDDGFASVLPPLAPLSAEQAAALSESVAEFFT